MWVFYPKINNPRIKNYQRIKITKFFIHSSFNQLIKNFFYKDGKMNYNSVDVSCLGTCNIDFISRVPFFAQAEDEVDVKKLYICLGGSALNFASRISSLGFKTGIMARVGEDYYGMLIGQELRQMGIDTRRLLSLDDDTGMAFVAIDEEGEKSVYSYIGANAHFKLEKEDKDYIKNSNHLHLTGMYSEVAEEASKYANQLSFNPGTPLSAMGIEKLENIIKRTKILFLNQNEVSLLTKMKGEDGISLLLEMGVLMVVVTSAGEGARLFTEEGMIFSPAKEVCAVDTTGAGDNFAAGFIASFMKGNELKECLDLASHTASLCVGKIGGTTSRIRF